MKTKQLLLVSLLFIGTLLQAQTTRYVKQGGTGNGTSWANASGDLQAMINVSSANDKIFVAKGTYKPERVADNVTGAKTPNNRNNAFVLKDGVKIYGNFAGTETTLAQRNVSNTANKTILSGDIDNDDTLTNGISTTINGNNAHHVVISVSDTNATVLDGFIITGGNANGSNHITVETGNIYRYHGGGMYNYRFSPTITNTTFSGNTARYGGGMYNRHSSPSITNTTFSGNTARYGGGMYNRYSSPSITNTTFNRNKTTLDGGGMCNNRSSPSITNTTFSGNTAARGGGMYNRSSSSPTITNTTFSGNTANDDGGAISSDYSSPKIYNSIFWNNKKGAANNVPNADIENYYSTPTVEHSLLQLAKTEYPTTGSNKFIFSATDKNIYKQDPKFVSATNLRLQASSPAINAGNNAPAGVTMPTTDANGYARIYNTTVDMGAYEYQPLNPNTGILYVKKGGAGIKDGSSWANAVGELADALKWANAQPASVTNTLKIYIAKGTYKPTSGTNQTDSFTIPAGVIILGGFNGTETNSSQRNWAANPTILSGDLNNNNNADAGDSHTIITILTDNVIVDGFQIEYSYADDDTDNSQVAIGRAGGGIYIRNLGTVAIKNCKFRAHNAHGNGANGVGGAIVNFDKTTTIINSLFYNNTASANGGAISAESGTITITNCTIANNNATNGGGVHFFGANVSMVNSIFTNNSGTNGNINDAGLGTATAKHCLFFNSTTGNNGNIPPNVTDGGNNLPNKDPAYNAINSINGYLLLPNSPAIDKGDNTANTETYDLAHKPRISDADFNGTATISIGAYESLPPFTETSISLLGVDSSSVAWGDYDNDGDLDMLLTGWRGSSPISKIYTNNGNGTFTQLATPHLPGVGSSSVAWGDYDNDGDLDILLTGGGTRKSRISKIYTNNNGVFNELLGTNLTAVSGSSVAWGDYDNDGDLDILLTGRTAGASIISKIYTNEGNGTFSELTTANLLGVYASSVAWGDYDNDGDLDILLTGEGTGRSYISKIYTNKGNGNFEELLGTNLPGVRDSSVAWGDYDNDGDLDILLTGWTGRSEISKIYTNKGNGNFKELPGTNLTGVYASSVAWGDYDNDGDLDILLTGWTGRSEISKIYTNKGNGNFKELPGTNLARVRYSSAAWGDYDNDGDLDILLTGQQDRRSLPISKIYTNNIEVANTTPTAPTNPTVSVNGGKVTLRWSASTDAQTPSATLTYNVYIKEAANYTKSPMAQENNGWRKLPALGNAQHNTSYTYTLPKSYCGTNTNFTFKVQAIDHSFAGSAFSTEGSFTVDLTGNQNIAYVNTNASGGTADGLSWANAYSSLQQALNNMSSCVKEIWVAKGTYKPGTNQTDSFKIPEGVSILGGFNGTETTKNQRNWATNPTILSGDLNNNNTADAGDSHTIITILTKNVVVDGFIIENAFADQNTLEGRTGAGILNRGTTTVKNCVFRNLKAGDTANSVTGVGGAIINFSGTLNIVNSLFYRNEATHYGGAISLENGTLSLTNTTVVNNKAGQTGGGINNNGTTTVVNSVFANNTATTSKNISNTPTVSYSYLQGEKPAGTGNIDGTKVTDPLFTNATNNDYSLQLMSTLINVGDNSKVPSGITVDLAGNPRIFNTTIDMGAYENQIPILKPTASILYVKKGGAGTKDGSSWANAVGELADALKWANAQPASVTNTLKIFVAKGTYKSGTNQTDSFKIPAGVSLLGGFNGTETNSNQRNWATNPTILSGDLNSSNSSNQGDSHTIITILTDNVVVDGFQIEYSYADGTEDSPVAIGRAGGGIYIRNAGTTTIKNCKFRAHNAHGNASNGVGGAIVNFQKNTTIINSLFYNNTASANGGAISAESGTVTIINATIANNNATNGGGVHFFAANVSMVNSIFTNNSGTNGNINDAGPGTATAKHCLFFNSTTGNNGNIPSNVTDGGNNIPNKDPAYNAINSINGYQLLPNSPAKDKGDNSANTETKDLAGNNRILETTIDIGAYEYKTPPFTEASISLQEIFNSSVAWGDYDNDGDLDMLLTGGTGSSLISKIYTNNNGVFNELSGTSLPGVYYSSVAWGDYDNDGDLDILLTGVTGSLRISKIYTNNNGVFKELAGTNLTGVANSSVAWGDYDNDGDLDILLTGRTAAYTEISKIYTNNNGTFSELTTANLAGVYYSSVAWGDYDNDGDLDILLTGSTGGSGISKIYTNNGGGNFSELPGTNLAGVEESSVAWGDYDNDGDLDILLTGKGTGSSRISKIYTNKGNGNFKELPGTNLTGVYDSSVAWGDYDNDGDLDILLTGVTGRSEISKIYTNKGNGTFSELPDTNLTGVSSSSVAWGDYDNDGDLDILLTGRSGAHSVASKIYTNNIKVANTTPTAPTNPTANVNGDKVTLRWSASTDAQTPSAALTYNVYIKDATNYIKSPMAQENNGWRKLPALGNAQHNTSYTYTLPAKYCGTNTNFTFKVQAIDHSFAGSAFSTEGSFSVDLTGVKTVAYVNANVSGGTADGLSWANAYSSLQQALNSIDKCIDEIWVAKGTYKPGTNQTDSFVIPEGVSILGGFNGAETTKNQRNWATNPTILSGDLNNNNTADAGDSHTIVSILKNNVAVDGFIIENAFADENTLEGRTGAGILNRGNTTVKNCVFRNLKAGDKANSVTGVGAAIINFSGTLNIVNSVLYRNEATHYGGAISLENGALNLTNCTVVNNTAGQVGGGINNNGTTTVVNSVFANNTATTSKNISNTPTVSYSYLQGENPTGTGNINGTTVTNPLFTDATNNDYSLQLMSTLINVGDNTAHTNTKDLAGNTRKVGVIDIGAYEYKYSISSWTGTTNTSWATATNWTRGVPNATSSVIIPNTPNKPVINNSISVADIHIANNALLTINPSANLTVSETLNSVNKGVSLLSNATNTGSLRVVGKALGGYTYQRYVGDRWHFISVPMANQSIQDFVTNSTNSIRSSGGNYYVITYDNSTRSWNYINSSTSGNFELGKGYGFARTKAGYFTFNGDFVQQTDKNIALTTGANNWNMIGNPYPMYINANDSAALNNNILAQNITKLVSTNAALYLWDSTTNSYKAYNHSVSNPLHIAPGQAFFVEANVATNFTITTTMLNHVSGNHFLKATNTQAEITITLQNGNDTKTTEIKFLPNAQKGLDIGYDAGLFNIGDYEDFELFTTLVDNSYTDVGFCIQCLPLADAKDSGISLGVFANANKKITFSASTTNLPNGTYLYLEDKKNNTFFDITNANSKYSVTTESALNGTGRFYLHTRSTALSTNEVNNDMSEVQMYMSKDNVLHIQNIKGNVATLKLFDLLGKEVQKNKFTITSTVHQIPLLKKLSKAVYIARLQTEYGVKLVKLIP